MTASKQLFTSQRVGSLSLANRFVMTAHTLRLPQDAHLAYLQERARGGVAMVVLPASDDLYAHPAPTPDRERALPPGCTPGQLRARFRVVRAAGVPVIAQLGHPGMARGTGALEPPIGPVSGLHPRGRVARALTGGQISRVIDLFAASGQRALALGADGVEVHAAHGYLLAQFLDRAVNTRRDEYGGGWRGRTRIVREIARALRRGLGRDAVIGLRLGDALDAGECCALVRSLCETIDYVSVSVGTWDGLPARSGLPPRPYVAPWVSEPLPGRSLAKALRQAAGLPVIVAGGITTVTQAASAVEGGWADLVGLTRALIADPNFPAKARSSQGRIRRCIGANECHVSGLTGRPFACVVNPRAGRGRELAAAPATAPRSIVVVGGGPAGMTAAATAAARGHQVSLYERSGTLGGRLAALVSDPLRKPWQSLLSQLVDDLHASGTAVHLRRRLSARDIAGLAPDAVVVATGARQPRRRGLLLSSAHVLYEATSAGRRVLVAAGANAGFDPVMTALLLAHGNREVLLSTVAPEPAAGIDAGLRAVLLARLAEVACRLLPRTTLECRRDRATVLRHVLTGQRVELEPCDTIMRCDPGVPRSGIARALGATWRTETIGDALAPRHLLHATVEGTAVGSEL